MISAGLRCCLYVAIRVVRTVVVAGFLGLSAEAADAGDYSVVYAVEVADQIETGKVEGCVYTKQCEIRSSLLGTSILAYFIYPANTEVSLAIQEKAGCCYFSDGDGYASIKSVDAGGDFEIFWGRWRRQNEFVGNKRVGVLHVKFLKSR